MRLVPHMLLLATLAWGLTGCALFKKNTDKNNDAPANPGSQVPPPKFPVGDPIPAPTQSSAKTGGALLAGRVLDGPNRPPSNTSILVLRVDNNKEEKVEDVPVSAEGHFTLSNLQPGGHYKLIARGKNGDRMVAAVQYATAPNARILIQLREDLVGSNTPPPPNPFDSLKEKEPRRDDAFVKQTPAIKPNESPTNAAWQPTDPADKGEFTLPAVHIPARLDLNTVAENKMPWLPPPLEIKPPTPIAPKAAKIELTMPPQPVSTADSLGPAKVPSCVLVGRQLVNFALNDINGEPWEFRANKKGKLILIDFWGSWCAPCIATLPTLKNLQQKHGVNGLEVVGIAYESDGSPQEQAYKVNAIVRKQTLNYRQLLGSGPNCVVKTQLGVRAYPTLILVDDQGAILWRHEGRLNSYETEELDRLIQTRLRGTF